VMGAPDVRRGVAGPSRARAMCAAVVDDACCFRVADARDALMSPGGIA
jgi:hypothetical protein